MNLAFDPGPPARDDGGVKKRDVEGLYPDLESEDAFARLDGERRLRAMLQRDFGYRWDGPPGDRAAAVERLKEWLAAAAKKEKERRTPFPGLAAVDLASLKGMSPQEVEKHLQALLGKAQIVAAARRPRCEDCGKRAATVEIVEVRSRKARGVRRLCDTCAAEAGQP